MIAPWLLRSTKHMHYRGLTRLCGACLAACAVLPEIRTVSDRALPVPVRGACYQHLIRQVKQAYRKYTVFRATRQVTSPGMCGRRAWAGESCTRSSGCPRWRVVPRQKAAVRSSEALARDRRVEMRMRVQRRARAMQKGHGSEASVAWRAGERLKPPGRRGSGQASDRAWCSGCPDFLRVNRPARSSSRE